MKLYAIRIKPESPFGSPLSGDTIFGHFCWQLNYDSSLVEGGIDAAIKVYPEKPFAVFSSALQLVRLEREEKYLLKRPDMPLGYLFDRALLQEPLKRKQCKKRRWLISAISPFISVRDEMLHSRQELVEELRLDLPAETTVAHNTINRLTGTTGKAHFAPYNMPACFYPEDTLLDILVLIDQDLTDAQKI
ncbi:MAG: hypothetical protein D6719_04380, partial [Candidatus Dadabacteria bacterium]